MAFDFRDIDLSSLVEGVSEVHSRSPFSDYFANQSRVTASGFTNSETNASERVGDLIEGDLLPREEIQKRMKGAKDIETIMNMVSLSGDQMEYGKSLIERLKNPMARCESISMRMTDQDFMNTISAVGLNYIKKAQSEVAADLSELESELTPQKLNPRRRRDSVVSESVNTTVRSQTIQPNDSVSMVGGMRKLQYEPNQLIQSVIGGYKPKLSTFQEERLTEIAPIDGLPIIFHNDRLNFLAHLHKPLKKLLTFEGSYPCDHILEKLRSFIRKHQGTDRDPADNLLYMVIRDTISITRSMVKSNRFQLPLLEPGMFLTEKIIYMSIDQLYKEYSRQWFETMKDVEVPEFHSIYKNRGLKSMLLGTGKKNYKRTRTEVNYQ
jgi:hypothetical protein